MFIVDENHKKGSAGKLVFYSETSGDEEIPKVETQKDQIVQTEAAIKAAKESLEAAKVVIESKPIIKPPDIATLNSGKSVAGIPDENSELPAESLNTYIELIKRSPAPTMSELQSFYNINDTEGGKINRLAVGTYLASKIEKKEGSKIRTPNFVEIMSILKNTDDSYAGKNMIANSLGFYKIEEQKEALRMYISQKFELAGLGKLTEIKPGEMLDGVEKPTIFTLDKDGLVNTFGIKTLSNGTVKVEMIQNGETSMNARSPDIELINCLNAIGNMQRMSTGMMDIVKTN